MEIYPQRFPLTWVMDWFHLPVLCLSLPLPLCYLSVTFWHTIQQKPLANQYGKFHLKKASNSYFHWFFNVDPEHISALKPQIADVLGIFKIFTFDRAKYSVIMSIFHRHFSPVMVENDLKLYLDHYWQQEGSREMQNILLFFSWNYICSFWWVPYEYTLRRVASIRDSDFCDFPLNTPTDQIRMLVWGKWGLKLRGRGGIERQSEKRAADGWTNGSKLVWSFRFHQRGQLSTRS